MVEFAKTLSFQNWRLRVFHALLSAVFLIAAIIEFYSSGLFAMTVNAAPYMWMHLEPLPPIGPVKVPSSFRCPEPNSTIECARMCSSPFVRDIACVSISDTVVRRSETQFLLTTYMQQMLLPREDLKFQPDVSMWWLPIAEATNISIKYGFTVDISTKSGSQFVMGPKRIVGSSLGSEGTPLTTVVLDSHGKVWCTFPPGRLTLSFREIAYLIGHDNFLDAPNKVFYAEELLGLANRTQHPPIRKTGTRIELVVLCSSRDPYKLLDWWRASTAQPQKCTLKAHHRKISGDEEVSFDMVTGVSILRNSFGVGFEGVTQGQFEFPSVSVTLSNLVIFMVFMSFPKKIVRFIAAHCLGDLSRIYRGVLNQKFDIRDEVATKAVRLAAESVTYTAIDTSSQERDGNSVTMKCLSERVQVALSSMLDKREARSLASFSMHRLAERGQCHTARRDVFGRMNSFRFHRGLGWTSATSPPESVGAQDRVPVAVLFGAESSADPIRLQALAALFDKDRNVSLLEKAFTPTALWNQIHAAGMATDVEHGGAGSPSGVVGRALADDLEEDLSALQQPSEATEGRLAGAEHQIHVAEKATDVHQGGADISCDGVALTLADDLEHGNLAALQKRLEASELRLAAAESQIHSLQSNRHELEAILDNIKMNFPHVYACSENAGTKSKPGVFSIDSSPASQAYTAPFSPSTALLSAEGARSQSLSTAPLATSSKTVLSQGPHTCADAFESLRHDIEKLFNIQAEAQADIEKLSACVKRLEQGSRGKCVDACTQKSGYAAQSTAGQPKSGHLAWGAISGALKGNQEADPFQPRPLPDGAVPVRHLGLKNASDI